MATVLDANRRTIRLVTCVGVETENALLPHFIDHYQNLGVPVANMAVVLNTTDPDSANLARAREILAARGVPEPIAWIAPYTSDAMWQKRRSVQAEIAHENDWIISADVDEFHEFPTKLDRFLSHCEHVGVNTVQGVFMDRLSPDGALTTVDDRASIWKQFPVQADVACRLGRTGEHHNYFGTIKLMAFTANVWPDKGGHVPMAGQSSTIRYWAGRDLGCFPTIGDARFRFFLPMRVHHFKWTANLATTLRRRLATPGVSAAGAEYSRKVLDYIDKNGGVRITDVAVRRSHRRAHAWKARRQVIKAVDAWLWYRSRLANVSRKFLPGGSS